MKHIRTFTREQERPTAEGLESFKQPCYEFSHGSEKVIFTSLMASLMFDEYSSALAAIAIDDRDFVWILDSWASKSQPIDFNFTGILASWKEKYKLTKTVVGKLGMKDQSDKVLRRFIGQSGDNLAISRTEYLLPNEGLIELQQIVKAKKFKNSACAAYPKIEELLQISVRDKEQNIQCLAFLQGICEATRYIRSGKGLPQGRAIW